MTDEMLSRTVGFIGAGRMATALAGGLLRSGSTTVDRIVASDVSDAARKTFQKETGAEAVASNADVVERADVLILAVKPQFISPLLAELSGLVGPRHLVVSIAAGVTLETLASGLGGGRRLARVMPNTPCLVGQGASAFAVENGDAGDVETVRELFSSSGVALEVPERMLDAVTGLSGSGPAYAFQIIEALSDGGVKAGLPRDVATTLAAQTLLGAAQMVLSTGQHPAALKDAVASPGGTTIAGLHELERGGLRATLINAVLAATERSKELAQS